MSSNIRRSMLTESDDSTEDLILKEETPSPNGMLSTEPYLNYIVEVPNANDKQRSSCKTKFLLSIIVILGIICVIFACLFYKEKNLHKLAGKESGYCLTPACIEASAFIKSSLEETIDPCEDFYLYACGGWLVKNPIPDGRSRWGIDSDLGEKNRLTMKNILQDPTKKETNVKSTAEFKSFQLYRSCMDTKKIEKLGVKPLKELLVKIGDFSHKDTSILADVSSKTILQSYLTKMHKHAHMRPFFSYYITADDMDSKHYVIKLMQSGLGLSQYQYDNNDTSAVIQAYVGYLTALAEKIYDKSEYSRETLETFANETYHFEKRLKQIFVPDELLSTVEQTYHLFTIAKLAKIVPNIDWLDYMNFVFDDANITLKGDERIIINTPKYFEKLGNFLSTTPLRVVLNHGIFHAASSYSPFLTDDFKEIKKNLSIAENGVFKIFPRWKQCVSSTDSALGMALGALFVKKAFAKNSQEEANKMVQQLRSSYIKSFNDLEWMDEETRKAAAQKAEAIYQKIGYPPFILDTKKLDKYYEGMAGLNEEEYFTNEINILKYENLKELKMLRKTVDRTEWYMTPPTINAYYEPSSNQIVFPAGILQPPYFKVDYPKVVNYGSMGSVIGHEITHGFDNNGRLYDKEGNYHGSKSWWTQSSLDGFNKRKQCFVDQYSQFVEAGVNIRGNVTLGENIADNGGLKAAYRAYKDWVAANGEEKLLPGLSMSNEQVFFIAFGQSWCTEELNARLVKQVQTDVHSPAIDRVRGTVENNAEFARIFNCPLKSNMNPEKKCSIW